MAAKDDFDALGKMAEWLGLDDEERGRFLDIMMEKKGHKKVSSWADADPEGNSDKGDGNVFGIKPNTKKSSSGPGWQYGA